MNNTQETQPEKLTKRQLAGKRNIKFAQAKRHLGSYENSGRPTKMTPDTIRKLEEAFAIGCTDKEACFYANISHETLYKYQLVNPEFVERKEALKEKPILLARQTVVKKLTESYSNAMDFLSRKRKSEFSQRQELTGEEGQAIKIEVSEAIAKKNGIV